MPSDQRGRPADWPKPSLRETLAWLVINPAYGRPWLWRTRLAQRLTWGPSPDRPVEAEALTFEELLAHPDLTFGQPGELLPHLLAFGPVKDCLTCRPGIYCPTHTPRSTP